MSIWGKRVDSWFTRGRTPTTRSDYNRMGLESLLPVLAVLVVAVVVIAFAVHMD